jgi:hypothetical protein
MTDVSSSGKTDVFDNDASVSKPQVVNRSSKPELNSKEHKGLSKASFDFFFGDSKKASARQVFLEPDRDTEEKEKPPEVDSIQIESENISSSNLELNQNLIKSDERDELKKNDDYVEALKISRHSEIRDIASGMFSGE